jgi:phosphoglycerol transferase MdoB-like AlkP superfamily enzyme
MMKLGFPVRLFLFWLIIFQIARISFSLFLLATTDGVSGAELLKALFYGIRLDISTACYLSAVPLLLYLVQTFYPPLIKVVRLFLGLELFTLIILLLANIQVYRAWGTLINRRAVTFLADPSAIMDSLSGIQIIGIAVFFTLIFSIAYYCLNRFVLSFVSDSGITAKNIIVRLVFILLLPLGIRGGVQQIPVNESAVAFSADMRVNNAAMNPAWYFVNNLIKSGLSQKNIYKKYTEAEALALKSQLFNNQKNTVSILKNEKPNIILIALESWTADIIAPLEGEAATTPFFNSLCGEGLLFTQHYSSGRRTDQMFPSVLSGFPSQPDHSIIRFPSKTEQLPMLSRDLKNAGYSTSFYYGGELGFANMRNYLLQGKFDQLISKEEFEHVTNLNKWGAHDEYVLKRHSEDLRKMQEPFFTFLLTLSTHEPFDVPGGTLKKGAGEPDKFRNAATYTDRCLKDYFDALKKSGLYEKTLIILVADHGHLLPRERQFNDPAVYRIPLLLCGGALKQEYHGKQINSIGGQQDIPATILSQLQLPDSAYRWSNDLLNKNRTNFAYLNMDDASGWIENSGSLVWMRSSSKAEPTFTSPALIQDDARIKHLTAYLQLLFEDFLKN